MRTRTKQIAIGAMVLAVGVTIYALTASSEEVGPALGPRSMHHGMAGMMGPGMGGSPGMMGPAMGASGHNAPTMAQLQVIHELFLNHDHIKRTVTNLPDGIRTVTESDDPQTAQLIKTHVASMDQRVRSGDDPGLPIESDALHAIFRDKDKIRTTVETTANGIVVVQTSSDPSTVAALQEHASQVSDFVQEGMVAVRTAMMGTRGGMMHGGMMRAGMMHGGMMGRGMMDGLR